MGFNYLTLMKPSISQIIYFKIMLFYPDNTLGKEY